MEKKSFLISVVIPIYNISLYLEEAINSMFIELETARNEIKTYEKEPEKPTELESEIDVPTNVV